jgi:hypothetical protein
MAPSRFWQSRTPCQHEKEWRIFLELCDAHFRNCHVVNPVVVEVGIYDGCQRAYYRTLWDAEYIGVDFSVNHAKPDILGDTTDPATLEALKARLGGRPIDLLFIDANHGYEFAKNDWEKFGPLCRHIVAFHDTENENWPGVNKLWRELTAKADQDPMLTFVGIQHSKGKPPHMGIGIIIKDASLD